MKNLAALLFSLLMSTVCLAQKELLLMSEQNKYTYFQVKPAGPNTDATALTTYLKQNAPGLKSVQENAGKNGVTGTGNVLVYKQGLLTGQEEGAITYKLSVDFKDDKYRIILTDFIITPYQRNRYGVFAPVDGVTIALEKADSRFTTKQLNSYLARMGGYSAKMDKLVSDFVTGKAANKPATNGLKKVDTQKW